MFDIFSFLPKTSQKKRSVLPLIKNACLTKVFLDHYMINILKYTTTLVRKSLEKSKTFKWFNLKSQVTLV